MEGGRQSRPFPEVAQAVANVGSIEPQRQQNDINRL
jgi:hypothetical protein